MFGPAAPAYCADRLVGNAESKPKEKDAAKKCLRKAAGVVWNDSTLLEWPQDDYRIFVGDLGNEVTDEALCTAFRPYSSFQRAKVVRNKRTNKSKGYGFVSFGKPEDMLAAMKEMHLKYVGTRPIRVKRSRWQDRAIDSQKNKALGKSLDAVPLNSKTMRKFKVKKDVAKRFGDVSKS
ncbi:MAG: hypothetical protein KVP17_000361 [Porospora cf. gigantea B]|uniref:uncharacterized protein n=1 Tax=Porospora cf. gigantea B TaxID=2853592 RepID=UPI003571AA6B|nr:MAG: hypothetical protein KVP17_000361 [Porospora cf. gigantea B]